MAKNDDLKLNIYKSGAWLECGLGLKNISNKINKGINSGGEKYGKFFNY